MLHYYLQKGMDPDKILMKSYTTKLFYHASMILAQEERSVDETGL